MLTLEKYQETFFDKIFSDDFKKYSDEICKFLRKKNITFIAEILQKFWHKRLLKFVRSSKKKNYIGIGKKYTKKI